MLLVDRSGSMIQAMGTGTRWDVLSASIGALLQTSSGFWIGLEYFPHGAAATWCSASVYDSYIDLAMLPGSVSSNITAWMSGVTPNGGSPSPAALEGTIGYLRSAPGPSANARRAVLLTLDGEPNVCAPDDTITALAQAAAKGMNGSPPVLTYTIAVGETVPGIDQVAAAGGTGQSYTALTAADLDAALLDVRTKLLACP